jgi:hypothetical protein
MTDHEELIAFVLECAANVPNLRRARIYRSLAEICGDPAEVHQLRHLADQLTSTEKLCRQFEFNFIQRTSK